MEFPKEKAKHYPGFTLHPFFHKKEQMPWAAAAEVPLEKAERIIYLSGETGRDPETDREPMSWQESRAGVGRVLGDIKEQTLGAWTRIKEILEGLDARLEDIAVIHYFLVKRDDWWDCKEATQNFFRKNCPDLIENPRVSTILKDIGLDLPEMRIEIEVIAVTGKK
ncbi:MAG: hypothetical protein HYX88_00160 [Chloroflexi bacterium]|nr:hypothetical protein [Chloroflexota bacterium]